MVRKVRVTRRMTKKLNFTKGFTDNLNEETGTTGMTFEFRDDGKMKVQLNMEQARKYADNQSEASGNEESDGEEEKETTVFEVEVLEDGETEDGNKLYKMLLRAASAVGGFLKKILKCIHDKLVAYTK